MHEIKIVRTVLASIIVCFLLSAAVVHAQPKLPPPETVALDNLGFMEGFPPPPEKVVNSLNKHAYPRLRWALQNSRSLDLTRNIRRGALPVSRFETAPRDLDGFVFEDHEGKPITIAEWQKKTYTDALVVLHKGKIIYERYHNKGADVNPHVLFSITKSFTGLLAEQLIHEGKIKAEDTVVKYVPELAGSAWGDMTVRHVLDMTGSIHFREDYTDFTCKS